MLLRICITLFIRKPTTLLLFCHLLCLKGSIFAELQWFLQELEQKWQELVFGIYIQIELIRDLFSQTWVSVERNWNLKTPFICYCHSRMQVCNRRLYRELTFFCSCSLHVSRSPFIPENGSPSPWKNYVDVHMQCHIQNTGLLSLKLVRWFQVAIEECQPLQSVFGATNTVGVAEDFQQ